MTDAWLRILSLYCFFQLKKYSRQLALRIVIEWNMNFLLFYGTLIEYFSKMGKELVTSIKKRKLHTPLA